MVTDAQTAIVKLYTPMCGSISFGDTKLILWYNQLKTSEANNKKTDAWNEQ